jgi:hypothetical protein
MDNLEYIKIRNRSTKGLKLLQQLFIPFVVFCSATFFWMGWAPTHSYRTGALYVWIGFAMLLNFTVLLSIQHINLPPIIDKTEECPKGPFIRN